MERIEFLKIEREWTEAKKLGTVELIAKSI